VGVTLNCCGGGKRCLSCIVGCYVDLVVVDSVKVHCDQDGDAFPEDLQEIIVSLSHIG